MSSCSCFPAAAVLGIMSSCCGLLAQAIWAVSNGCQIPATASILEGIARPLVRRGLAFWRSPFLRPMRLTITDDDECPKGAQKYDAIMGGRVIRKCGCQEDYFIKNTDLGYCDTVTRCPKCPEGMACDFHQDARSQQLKRAFTEPELRHSSNALNPLLCR